ncbi:MAG: peptidoglycan DD-metalloendopeptidase family protein, partial [Nitrospinaceae bacterium]|nr:peptidoglycan DD-metalloendopeptidase family protein [Nitrospinaceae bacterium]
MVYRLGDRPPADSSNPVVKDSEQIKSGKVGSGRYGWLLAVLFALPVVLAGCQYLQESWEAMRSPETWQSSQGDKGRIQGGSALKPPVKLPRGVGLPADALPDGPTLATQRDRFRPNDSVFAVLAANGLERDEIFRVLRASRSVYSLSRIGVGNRYELAAVGKKVHRFLVQVDSERRLRVYRTKRGPLRARLELIPYDVENVRVKMKLQDSLFGTINQAGIPLAYAVKLNEIFEWVVDFHKGMKGGESIELLIEKRSLDGYPAGLGRILAARIEGGGKKHAAVLFDSGYATYYTPEGETLKRAFLKSPLKYTRISSRFTRKRFHPILKRYRPHLGVDYAAPKGTPVRSVADGVVASAGWKGAAGKMVKVRHSRGYVTSYLHLSRIGRGVRSRARVILDKCRYE